MPNRASAREKYEILSAKRIRAHIAAALRPVPNELRQKLGDVVLQPHQLFGVSRLLDVMARHRGALLADEVGLGKTYTALGVARRFERTEVVAPATLRAMWHEASSRAEVAIDFVTSESLSRSALGESGADLVIVDEAHWFRNAATKRYRSLARRYRSAAVLLLSATPLHNRAADLQALFGLFLGQRARCLTPHDIGVLTVRRGRPDVAAATSPPRVLPTKWRRVRCDPRVLSTLEALEAPIPARDAEVALALLRLTLLHRLSSSHAALRTTLKRLLSRALALLDAANAGRYPTADELRAWLTADDAIQLAFPELVIQASDKGEAIPRDAIERHIDSLRAAIGALDAAPNQDKLRADFLGRLLRLYPNARIVAFSQYNATVMALGRLLSHEAGIVVLSAKGGRIASGRISRAEVLQQFDAAQTRVKVSDALRIRLLLTTDLLSEGVNLHNANVVVHLDLPWTAARLEQRIGRLSRMGSAHKRVHVFGFAPPTALDRVQSKVARLRAKWHASRRRFGASTLLSEEVVLTSKRASASASHASDAEALRTILSHWLGSSGGGATLLRARPAIAQVSCGKGDPFALALVRTPDGPALIGIDGAKAISTRPRDVLQIAQRLTVTDDIAPQRVAIGRILRRLRHYIARRRGEEAARSATNKAAAALQTRIASTIARLPRNTRHEVEQLSTKLRESIARARSAGDHQLLAEKAAHLLAMNAEPARWLTAARKELASSFGHHGGALNPDASTWSLDAILIGT